MNVETSLSYQRKPVRAVVIDGRAWFSADDVYRMFGRKHLPAATAHFASNHVGIHTFGDASTAPAATLSTVGAQTVAAAEGGMRGRIAGLWLAKKDRELRASNGQEADHVPLTMLADGRLPPQPEPGGPHWNEWLQLQADQRSAYNPLVRVSAAAKERQAAASDETIARPRAAGDKPLGLKPPRTAVPVFGRVSLTTPATISS